MSTGHGGAGTSPRPAEGGPLETPLLGPPSITCRSRRQSHPPVCEHRRVQGAKAGELGLPRHGPRLRRDRQCWEGRSVCSYPERPSHATTPGNLRRLFPLHERLLSQANHRVGPP